MTSGNDPLAFAQLIPGFNFMRQFAQAASGTAAGAPGLTGWIAPTVSTEEIDKRITDLKAVQFWLEQNLHVLRATVQALEVQKMTLSTLQSMNVNLADIAQAFTVAPSSSAGQADQAQQTDAPTPPPASSSPPAQESAAPPDGPSQPSADSVDPLQWWNALAQQFQTIAANTLRDAARAVPPVPFMEAADAASKPRQARRSARQSVQAQSSSKPKGRTAKSTAKRTVSKPPAARGGSGT